MKHNQYEFPKSSFLGMAKDTSLIVNKILSNKNILKLLYYTIPNWKDQPDLTSAQIKSLFTNKQISNIPKVTADENKLSYLTISYGNFTPNAKNSFYRDHIVEIKILCHFDNWDLNDFELRPYRIAGELDSMLDGQHLTGIGELSFLNANPNIYDDEYGGITLKYLAIRGEEDRVNPLS